jgi:peroxiredoxin family protein
MSKSFGKALISVEALKIGLSKITDFAKLAINEALEAERSQIRFGAALEAKGMGQFGPMLEKQKNALADFAALSDETVGDLQSLALNMGVGAKKIDEMTRAAIALSNTTGTDLNSAMMALIKSTEGEVGALGRMWPEVKNMTEAQLMSGDAIKYATEQMGHNINLMSQGNVGKIQSMTNSLYDMAEALGEIVLKAPGVSSFLEMFEYGAKQLKGYAAGHDRGSLPQPKAKPGDEYDFAGQSGLVGGVVEQEKKASAGSRRRKEESIEMSWDATDAWAKEQTEIANSNAEQKLMIENRYYETRRAMLADQAEYEQDLINRGIEYEQQAYEAQLQNVQQYMGAVQGIQQKFADVGMDIMEQMIQGNKIRWKEVLIDMMKSIGKQLVAQGIYDHNVGVGKIIISKGSDATGYALASHGAAEIMTGVGLMAGSTALGTRLSGKGGGGGGSGGSFGRGLADAPGYMKDRITGKGGGSWSGSRKHYDDVKSAPENQGQIVVIGGLTADDQARLVQRGLAEANKRGMGV